MEIILIVAIVTIAIIFFVKQSNEKKRKIEQERKRQERLKYYAERTRQQDEEKRLALIEQKKFEEKKKLDKANRLKKVRLQKTEEEKYETSTIVEVKQLHNLDRLSETQPNKIQKEDTKQKAKEEKILGQNDLQVIETKQRNFCENNTTYCTDIQAKYNTSPINFGLTSIKSLSTPFYNNISAEMQNRIFVELNQGLAILQTEGHLFIYMRAYGNMHRAKLLQSFEAIPNLENIISNKEVQINDYGCGQGIGSIVFIDYIKSIQATNFTISKVKLIEPSELALKRASLNIKYCLRSINQTENVLSILKKIDDITTNDITTNSQAIKFHIFSNIIDVQNISIQSMCAKIAETQKGINYFICISPNIMQSRNERLDAFMNYFQQRQNVSVISTRENNINTWTRYERVFKVNFVKRYAVSTNINPELLAAMEESDK